MKKNLLITLGCSITEGVGCYGEISDRPNQTYHGLEKTERNRFLDRFHEFGWPNRVGRKLGYDKVLNLGKCGSANSLHLKLFVDKIVPKLDLIKKDYNVFVIWMMTDPTRFSFYTPTYIKSFFPAYQPNLDHMAAAYLKDMTEFNIGPAREQVFLIKLSEFMFKSLDITVAFTSWNSSINYVKKLYKSQNFLTPNPLPRFFKLKDHQISSVPDCGHPNEDGYEVIADNLVKLIKRYRPEFLLKTPNLTNKFEWEWDGSTSYKSTELHTSI